MRSIFITNDIEGLANKYSKDLFSTRSKNFVKPLKNLYTLSTTLGRKKLSKDYQNYVLMIIRLYGLLNHIKPKKFEKLNQNFFDKFNVNLEKKIKIGTKTKAFHKLISEAMRYDAVREKDFLPYVKKLGIRTCVYCNANYALSIASNKTDYGKFELDHFQPQSKFPYLCTNFYNLNPCCTNCNKFKLNKAIQFCLYEDNHENLSQFNFKLDKHSIVKYMLSQNFDDLEIVFNNNGNSNHEEVFKIQATYNVLKDVVEELIWKYKSYNSSYLNSLNDSFNKKFHPSSFYRFILGNYDQPQDIHKRPLSKLTQDIAKQLGIIK